MERIPVLIIGSGSRSLSGLTQLLESSGAEPIFANSKEQGAVLAGQYQFGALLIELSNLAKGYQAAEFLRDKKQLRSVPIIFLSDQQPESERKFEGFESAFVDYLYLPLQRHLVKSKIGVYLELHRKRGELEQKSALLDARTLELEVLRQEVMEMNEEIELHSSLDSLTGLFNRYYFDENLLKEWRQGLRQEGCLSLLLIDIDDFAAFKDHYGRMESNGCLRIVARALHEALLRPTDIVARYREEEFAAVLPSTDSDGSLAVAARMVSNVSQLAIEHKRSSTNPYLTISIGISTVTPNQSTVDELFEYASIALADIKQQGGNRIGLHSTT